MGRISSLTKDVVIKRLENIEDILTSLYYFMSDQDYNTWLRYCSTTTELEALVKELKYNDRQDQ